MTKRILVLFAACALAAVAQTSGTIGISGTIPEAFSLLSSSDGNLASSTVLGAWTIANNATMLAITPVDVRVRSNKAYKINASATFTKSAEGAADGGDGLAVTDIGFGITAIDATGANVANKLAGDHTVVAKFNYTAAGNLSLAAADGLSPFVAASKATLNDISGANDGAQVVSGKRISTKGNIATQTNFVNYKVGLAMLPQYFTPAGFASVVTLTISSN